MASQTAMPAFQANQVVRVVEAQAMEDGTRTLIGSLGAFIGGVTSANSSDAPLTVTVSGMVITAGGAGGQKILLNTTNAVSGSSATGPRLIDSVPTYTHTVPTADPSNPRHDIIYGTYAQTQVSNGSSTFATISGTTVTTSSGTVYNATEALTWGYVAGTPAASPTDPSVPSGAVAIARVTVPAGASSLSSGNITILLPTIQSQILSGISGYVDIPSAQTITGAKTFSATMIAGGMQLVPQTNTSLSGAGIRTTPTNSIIISPGSPGNALYLGLDNPNIGTIQFGPGSAWGQITGNGFTTGSQNATFGDNVSVKAGIIHCGGSSLTWAAPAGDIIAERGNTTGVLYLGNTGNAYLYYDGSNYNMANGALNISGINAARYLTFGSTTLNQNSSALAANVNGSVLTVSNASRTALTIDGSLQVGTASNFFAGGNITTVDTITGGYIVSTGTVQANYNVVASNQVIGKSIAVNDQGANVVWGINPAVNIPTGASVYYNGGALALYYDGGVVLAVDGSGNIGTSGALSLGVQPGTFRSLTTVGDIACNGTLYVIGNITTTGSSVNGRYVFSGGTNAQGPCPPMYTYFGGAANNNAKIVQGQTYVSGSAVVNLAVSAIFTNVSSYSVLANAIYGGNSGTINVNLNSGAQFTIYNNGPACTVGWTAIGY